MGSSSDSESTGVDGAPSASNTPNDRIDLHEILDRFGLALAIIETVCNALQAAESNSECPTVGAEITTLQQGVAALRAVHEELDLAIPGVTS